MNVPKEWGPDAPLGWVENDTIPGEFSGRHGEKDNKIGSDHVRDSGHYRDSGQPEVTRRLTGGRLSTLGSLPLSWVGMRWDWAPVSCRASVEEVFARLQAPYGFG